MAHSNRRQIASWLKIAEIVLFIAAIGAAYFSQKTMWTHFFWISAISSIVFIALKVIEIRPSLIDFTVREDLAAKLANSAIPHGLVDYFDMLSPSEQQRRNVATQEAIKKANQLWLSANSGASYLEPSIYRHWPAIERSLKNNIDFRVILLDPFSGEKAFRNRINSGGEHLDSKLNIATLIKLYNKFPSFDIRFAKYGMNCTVFAADKTMFVDPYHVGIKDNRIDNRSFCMKFEPVDNEEGNSMCSIFKSHLQTLWANGQQFEDWLSESRKANSLPSDLPQLQSRKH
ncbi:hypothetical protein FHT03_001069 [Xanthomonas arboricola]